jgi:hypothetical protein
MKEMSKKERDVLAKVLRQLGSIGGKASADSLTPEQRRARARKAGKASAKSLSRDERRARAVKAGKASAAKRREEALSAA